MQKRPRGRPSIITADLARIVIDSRRTGFTFDAIARALKTLGIACSRDTVAKIVLQEAPDCEIGPLLDPEGFRRPGRPSSARAEAMRRAAVAAGANVELVTQGCRMVQKRLRRQAEPRLSAPGP